MTVYLEHGRIFLRLQYGPGRVLTFESSNTYNNGEWVKVEAARALRNDAETGVLRVSNVNATEDHMNHIDLPPDVGFDVENSVIFVGGVTPDFASSIDLPEVTSVVTSSLLGSVRSITLSNPGSNTIINPLHAERHNLSPHFGVSRNCDERPEHTASFAGNGFVELDSYNYTESMNLGLTFATREGEGLILLSSFLGKNRGNIADYYTVSMVQGHLQIKLSSSAKPDRAVVIRSYLTYNDGERHTLNIRRQYER